jgi:hypothetical protein
MLRALVLKVRLYERRAELSEIKTMNTVFFISIASLSLLAISLLAELIRVEAKRTQYPLLRFLERLRADLSHEEPCYVAEPPPQQPPAPPMAPPPSRPAARPSIPQAAHVQHKSTY